MLYHIKPYLKFLWNSKNEHAVHSPFVFNLITKCFQDKQSKPDPSGSEQAKQYQVLKEYRKSLLENKNTIEETDFGAGSKVFKSNTRPIYKMVKTTGISAKRAKLLFRITNYFQPSTILEIGASLGLATSALALGSPSIKENAKITTLERCPNKANQCQLQLQKFNINNINCIVTEFSDYLSNFHFPIPNFELIYFDCNLFKTDILDNFELLSHTICNETLWIFNGIHGSVVMEEAWEIIKEHPKVTVTIDTFQWGIIFFRKEQLKEHFVIRI